MNDVLNKSVIRGHEGTRFIVYHDSRGYLSIGVGCNLDAAGASVLCARAGIDYDAARVGRAITPAQCDALFELQYEDVTNDLKSIFPGLLELPANAAAVVCDMRFELGAKGFREFRHFIAAVIARNWGAAIAQMRASLWASQVPGRVENDVSLLEAI